MKKVLIITYYWPPCGGISVQRWLKFVKYLPANNWEPILVIPENPDYPLEDKALLKQVDTDIQTIKVPIFEPIRWFGKIKSKKKSGKISAGFISENKKSLFDRISVWIRANIIIPDARRFWINPVSRTVSKYLEGNTIDCIVTTGPPHSVHLAGLKIKKKHPGIRWIADFRDPWTKIDFYKELNPVFWADWLHHLWEKKVVKGADAVITVGETNTQEFIDLGAKKAFTVTNGFDHDDFKSPAPPLSDKFTVTHVGTFMANRNSPVLWKALGELIQENEGFKEDFRLKFVGNVDYSVKSDLEKSGLNEISEFTGFVSQKEAVDYQKSAHVLLLIINNSGNPKGMITGKIFGYLASLRQILLIGPTDGDAAKIIGQTESGMVAEPENKEEIKKLFLDFYNSYKNGEDLFSGNTKEINKYSRENLTRDLVKILNLKT